MRDGVALLTVDNPPVNPMSSGVRFYMSQHLETALGDDNVEAVVITGKGRAFIAGADIRDFGKTPNPDEQPKRPAGAIMEGSDKPIVAAINGTAYGGGLEHALFCHYRVAAPGAPVGLPEIKIGLLPGGGGTQRLPRLIGAERAMLAILSGDPFETEEALALGIIDEIIDGDLVAGAIAFAKAKAAAGGPHPLVRNRRDKVEADRANPDVFKAGEAYLARRLRGQVNGLMAFNSVKAAIEIDDFDAGIRAERANFQVCLEDEQRAGDDSRLLRRAASGADTRCAKGRAEKGNRQRRDRRRRADGWRYRHVLRGCRDSREGARSQPGSARQGTRGHREQLWPHGAQRQDQRGRAG